MGINSAPKPRPTIATLIFRLMVRGEYTVLRVKCQVSSVPPSLGSLGAASWVARVEWRGTVTFQDLPQPTTAYREATGTGIETPNSKSQTPGKRQTSTS